MQIALSTKDKLVSVTGEFPFLIDTYPLRAPWKRVNDIVITRILNTISDVISNRMHIIYSAYAI